MEIGIENGDVLPSHEVRNFRTKFCFGCQNGKEIKGRRRRGRMFKL
jgi:hypothetical protein